MLSSTGKAYTQRYCSAPTALSLPDQSAHRDPVPVLAKGPAEAIITLGKKKKKSIAGRLCSQIVQGWVQNTSAWLLRVFSTAV